MIRAIVPHRLLGRIRIRSDDLCGQSALLRRIEQDLTAIHGIRKATGSDSAGSVLIEYDPALQSESQLLERLLNEHGIAIENAGDAPSDPVAGSERRDALQLARTIASPFDHANQKIRDLTDGYLDLRISVPVAFVLIGTWKVLRVDLIPAIPWYTYYWMSFRLFTIFFNGRDHNGGVSNTDASEGVAHIT